MNFITIFPMIGVIAISLTNWTGLQPPLFTGLDNFKEIFTKSEARHDTLTQRYDTSRRADRGCDPRVIDNRGKAALQRGPLVYCVEERDTDRSLNAISLGQETDFTACREPTLLGDVVVLRADGVTAIPYFAWANRGSGPMRLWLRNGGAH